MITHYDLFAGIGGFSLALEEVFHDEAIRHIFCEWEQFPTAVLKKHWPDGEFWGDIADLITHTDSRQHKQQAQQIQTRGSATDSSNLTIVTGGFPCQPFSAAGRRRGTEDDRYKWPEMLQVIRNVKPTWVIAENVRGLVTWSEGMVLEQVCTDLEAEGYEVQPLIIPAVAVNAPHRRDRVWIIACHTQHNGFNGTEDRQGDTQGNDHHSSRQNEIEQPARPSVSGGSNAHARPQRRQSWSSESVRPPRQKPEQSNREYPDWSRNWQEVAFATCDDTMDDGLSRIVDRVPYSRAKWRKESLKAYGNGIVPQVAMEIMRAIKAEQYGTPNS